MFIYMSALLKQGQKRYGEIIPAGVLYMPAIKPSVTLESADKSERIKQEVYKQLKMNGIILDAYEVIQGMESETKGVFIPVDKKKDGEFRNKEKVLAGLEEIGTIIRYVDNMVKAMAMELKSGAVSAYPSRVKDMRSCDWCAYGCICGYGDDEPVREIKDFKNINETVEKMLEREQEYNG